MTETLTRHDWLRFDPLLMADLIELIPYREDKPRPLLRPPNEE